MRKLHGLILAYFGIPGRFFLFVARVVFWYGDLKLVAFFGICFGGILQSAAGFSAGYIFLLVFAGYAFAAGYA